MSIATQKPTQITIGQRIGEILEERGSAFSIRAFSARIGFSKDMLSRMISGDRYISPSELQQIANGLSLSVARLKQEDTMARMQEIAKHLDNDEKYDRVLEIATEINQVAVGCTERFFVWDAIGKAHYGLLQFDKAHEAWLEAKECAERMTNRYGNSDDLYKVLHNLVLSFTEKKDFAGLASLVEKLKKVFEPYPRRLGTLYYSTGAAALDAGNHQKAKENFLRSLEKLEEFGRASDIGIAEHNIANVEYLLGNYEEAKLYFERALPKLVPLGEVFMICRKDYAKTLLKLGELEQARDVVQDSLNKFEEVDLPFRIAQFRMLHAIINNDTDSAEQVLMTEKVPNTLKLVACKFLMDYYKGIGDAENLMRYYVIAETYRDDDSAIYDEMGL